MINWSKWGRDYLFSLMRHCGTAGATWTGGQTVMSLIDKHSLTTGQLWDIFKTLPIALLFGAILPTFWTALQNPPRDEEPPASV